MERSLSTFANEMATCAMILGEFVDGFQSFRTRVITGIATSDSLVLIDEVGRGTSPEEGLGIAHALAEALIQIQVPVYSTVLFLVTI
jgi:DNA mismatch repair protein MSH4